MQYCEQVVANYIQNQIPLETFLTDIQYMDQNQDLTLSSQYPLGEFSAFVTNLHNNSQRWVSGLAQCLEWLCTEQRGSLIIMSNGVLYTSLCKHCSSFKLDIELKLLLAIQVGLLRHSQCTFVHGR